MKCAAPTAANKLSDRKRRSMPGIVREEKPPEVEGKVPPLALFPDPLAAKEPGDEATATPQPITVDVLKATEKVAEQYRNSSSPDSEPELNHSSSTCTTTSEGESTDSKECGNDSLTQDEQQPKNQSDGNEKQPGEGQKAMDINTLNIRLVLPGVQQPIDAMVSSKDTVHDLLQFAMERPECCYRTCLSVQLNGKKLDDFSELESIEELQEGAVVELVEEPYTQRDVRVHIQRLRDLLSTNPVHQSLNNSDGLTLSFLAAITLKDPEEGAGRGHDVTSLSQLEPPPYVLPQDHTPSPPLLPFYPPSYESFFKIPECLKVLSYSPWNPPPSHRRMKGDLLYIDLTTLEGQEYYLTACPTGFYLNKSADRDHFDPTPRKVSYYSRHLVGLLSQISSLFKKNFAQLQKFGEKRHAFEVLPVPYPVVPWIAPKPEHKPSNFRIVDSVVLKAAPDELILGQLRDWNEEIQMARELPTDTAQLKLFRDRHLFKITGDFIQAATRGAVAVIEGIIPPLNPGDEEKYQMYMWNNIFFSLAADGKDHYKEFGGDEAAHAAAAGDLHGVATYERLEPKDLYTVGTVLVDYQGYRVVCQSIISGLLQREQDSAVVYGSIDAGKSICTHDRFKELLKKSGTDLHIREHKVLTEKNEEVELPSSLEVKGIVGNDGRHYALDLFRIFPPDANYSQPDEQGRYRHKMAVLRLELVETFLSYRYMLFLKLAREKACELKVIQDLQKSLEAQAGGNKTNPVDKPSGSDGSETNESDSICDQKEPVTHTNQTENPTTSDPTTSDPQSSSSKQPNSNPNVSPNTDPSKKKANTSAIPRVGSATLTNLAAISTLATSPDSPSLLVLSSEDTTSGDQSPDSITQTLTSSGSEVYLVDGLEMLAQEKEVGEEIPPGMEEELACSMSSSEDLEKSIDLEKTHPEVMSVLREAAKEAGSTSDKDFIIQFNVDILAPGVNHADTEEVLERDRKLVRDATAFLLGSVIPRMVRDCIQLVVTPSDGESLKQVMHSRGINMRYLGKIAELAATREDLRHLLRLCESEMIGRIAKRRIRKLLQEAPIQKLSEAIAHFFNCYLGDGEAAKEHSEEVPLTNGQPRKKQRRKKGTKALSQTDSSPHVKVTAAGLWADIVEEVGWYYHYKLKYSSVDDACDQLGIPKLSLLRELCRKTGIQVVLREYDFSARPTFTDEDIISVYPIVKHTDFRPAEPVTLFELAQSKFASGNVHVAHELFLEALQLFVQVYGPMHVDIANCYRQIARIHYLVSEPVIALSYQHKACLVFERVLGVDHPETVTAYINLALYCHSTNQISAALRLMYRARYLLLVLYGEDHPELATCDSNIALMLLGIKDHENSLRFLQNALKIHERYHGKESLQTALSHHHIARVHSFLGDFRAALQHEKTTYSIYSNRLGAEHKRTKESSDCLQELTGKAVTMQKTINEMTAKGKSSGAKVMVELPGSWGDVANLINGTDQPRQQTRGQRPKNIRTHVVRKRGRSTQTQQQQQNTDRPTQDSN